MSENQLAPSPAQGAPKRSHVVWAFAAIWIIAVVAGLSVLWAWENTPGCGGRPPAQWPAESACRARPIRRRWFFSHIRNVPARRESVSRGDSRPATTPPLDYSVFLKPVGLGVDWEKTDLWRAATNLPGVTVLRDDDGLEATRVRRWITSGQTCSRPVWRTALSGGITGARGHAGDNAGRASLVSLLNQGKTDLLSTSVFGCPLFAFLD